MAYFAKGAVGTPDYAQDHDPVSVAATQRVTSGHFERRVSPMPGT